MFLFRGSVSGRNSGLGSYCLSPVQPPQLSSPSFSASAILGGILNGGIALGVVNFLLLSLDELTIFSYFIVLSVCDNILCCFSSSSSEFSSNCPLNVYLPFFLVLSY